MPARNPRSTQANSRTAPLIPRAARRPLGGSAAMRGLRRGLSFDSQWRTQRREVEKPAAVMIRGGVVL
jgi:hypothetical protein